MDSSDSPRDIAETLEKTPRRMSDVWQLESNGQARIISEAAYRAVVFELNECGSLIWQLADGSRTTRAIALAVLEHSDLEPLTDFERVSRDAVDFLEGLHAEHLIEWT